MRNLPSEKIVYFGDTARVPYGSKSKETIIRYSRQIIRFLQQQQVKAIVVACNTASAFALDAVRDEFDIPIIGVIEPGAKVAAAQTRNKRVGIIGTVGTVGSGIHAEYLKHLDPEITVFGKACPLFVPLVEEGWLHDPVTDEVAARYLKELQDKQVDTGTVIDLTGCSLDNVLYEVSAQRPVVAKTGENSSVVIVGYDEYNTYLYDPSTGQTSPYGMNDSTALFESAGNVFLTYIENVTE